MPIIAIIPIIVIIPMIRKCFKMILMIIVTMKIFPIFISQQLWRVSKWIFPLHSMR